MNSALHCWYNLSSVGIHDICYRLVSVARLCTESVLCQSVGMFNISHGAQVGCQSFRQVATMFRQLPQCSGKVATVFSQVAIVFRQVATVFRYVAHSVQASCHTVQECCHSVN